MNSEQQRLQEAKDKQIRWRKWGPYLSERQWGTVREDYSENGDAWNYFTHDQARSRAYRWGEDGLGGICDDHQIHRVEFNIFCTVNARNANYSCSITFLKKIGEKNKA